MSSTLLCNERTAWFLLATREIILPPNDKQANFPDMLAKRGILFQTFLSRNQSPLCAGFVCICVAFDYNKTQTTNPCLQIKWRNVFFPEWLSQLHFTVFEGFEVEHFFTYHFPLCWLPPSLLSQHPYPHSFLTPLLPLWRSKGLD